ncbi:carbohydrate esterase family 8 protein [Polyplosphaeria fusca]|uniref:pectinesterase n=1 Tax=Polyplosphaeria fusca TaxID=682080 RepID=A0A9P4V0M8_9PLEO|nr:carbohydrate esterase family 8 protein [Polyplosphaeria fusca]
MFLFVSISLAADRRVPPNNALVVRTSVGKGTPGFTKIQDAVNALDVKNSTAQAIFIFPGTYNEQVYIPALKSPLTIYGYTQDTSSYERNQVTITHNFSQKTVDGGNDKTATVRAWSTNFKMYNINLVNTYGKGSQALALSAQATNQGYYACQFKGYQDTILTNKGSHVFANSLIVGVTDFIFGQHASTWFDRVDIRVLSANLGYITANGRDSASDQSYFVINNSTVAAADGNNVSAGTFYLGRPWRSYARVVFQRTTLSLVVNAAGWRVWNTGEENIDHVLFGEFENSGPGASGKRASFGSKLAAPVRIGTILGTGWANATFVDRGYLSSGV